MPAKPAKPRCASNVALPLVVHQAHSGMRATACLLALTAVAHAERSVTDLRCEVGDQNIAAPKKLAPKMFERPPVGAIAPGGWLLEQLLLQSNSLAGYLSDSTFPGADHVNMSAWSGGNGSKAGGTIQWLPCECDNHPCCLRNRIVFQSLTH